MIDLKALEGSFAEIAQLGRQEETFEISGTPVTVKALSDEEQIHIWKYATVALEGGEDAATHQEWMHRMKVATLSHAIVQVGDQDLRDSFVDTGEVLKSGKNAGKPITREKFEVLRSLLAKWPSALLLRAFARYGDFVSRIEIQAEESVEMKPVDFDAEIERLEIRIKELKDRKDKATRELIDPAGLSIKQALGKGRRESHEKLQLAEASQQSQPPARSPVPDSAPVVVEPPVQPAREPLPEPPPVQESRPQPQAPPPVHEPRAPRREYSREQALAALGQQTQSPIDPESSFVDMEDPDTIDAIRRQEALLLHQKQQQARQRQKQALAQQEASVQRAAPASVPVRGGRRPPHAAAAQAQQAVSRQVTTVQGPDGQDVPVFQLEPQVLSSRGRQPAPDGPVVDPQSKGAVNPKFTPPGKGRWNR
jgi:hypothetical protein